MIISVFQILQLMLLVGVIIGGYRIRRTSELSLAGSLVAECMAFSLLLYFVVPIKNNWEEPVMIMIACLIGTLLAEAIPKKIRRGS